MLDSEIRSRIVEYREIVESEIEKCNQDRVPFRGFESTDAQFLMLVNVRYFNLKMIHTEKNCGFRASETGLGNLEMENRNFSLSGLSKEQNLSLL